jgi:hypothetical protein
MLSSIIIIIIFLIIIHISLIVFMIILVITIIINTLVFNKPRNETPYGVVGSLKWFLCTTMLHCHCAYLCAYYIVLHSILFMLHLLLDHSANIKIKVKKKYLYVNIISNTLLR